MTEEINEGQRESNHETGERTSSLAREGQVPERAPPGVSEPSSERSTKEPTMGEVVRLAWPITISMLSFTAMGLADTLFVSRLGTEPLAAVGMAVSTTFLILAFGMGLMGGVKVSVAQATGATDEDGVLRLGWQALWVAGIVGVTLATLAPFGPMLFRALGAEGEVGEMANAYFLIRVLGSPLTFAMLAHKSWFDGRGDTRTPMVANLIANGLNIALDPIFIFGWGAIPAMGVGGAAAATVLAMAVAMTFLAARGIPRLLKASSRRPERELLREIWRLGSPMGVRQLLGVGAWVLLVSVLARVGAIDLAAHVMVIRIVSVSFLPGYAISQAASVLVGQSVGAGNPLGARAAVRHSMVLAVAVMAVCGIVFVAFPEPLVGVFGVAPEVAALGRTLLIVAAGFQVFDAVAMVAQGALNGAGDTRFVMVTSVLAAWLLQLPVAVALALPMGMGAVGAWIGLTVEIAGLAAVSLWRVRGDRWLEGASVTIAERGPGTIAEPPGSVVAPEELAANEAPAA